ncbi:response regulator transcription factor [bacterium]|nr:response regulator transcription factor [bacterium]
MSLKILIADDHQIFRDGLRSLFDNRPDMDVIAEAENGRTAVQMAKKLNPDVVIMDISMPDLNGIEATSRIVDQVPNAKIIALSAYSSSRFVVEILKSGASGYLPKDSAFEELLNAIDIVVANQKYLSPKITGSILNNYVLHNSTNSSSAFSILTARERETLQLVVEGKNTKQIASILHVSTKSIEMYRRNIMKKLDLHSIAELTRYAIKEGLTSTV